MDVVIAAGGAAWETAALREVEQSSTLRLARRCVDVADLLATARAEVASAALVSEGLPGLDADVVYRLQRAGVRVAAVEADPDACRAVGIEHVVRLGALDDVSRDAEPVAREPDDLAPVLAVWGPAGSPGRSTVALAIASAAAAKGVDTVLVDADTYGGSQAQALAVLDDVSGVVAACRTANLGRQHEVPDHLIDVDPGLRLLSGIPRADMWSQVRPGAFDLVLEMLRRRSALVVVDCGFALEPGASSTSPSRNQTTLQVLERSSTIIAVGRADPVGLGRLVRGLHELAEVASGRQPVVAVNMMRSSLGWREREVEGTLHRLTGITPTAFLPFDQAGLDLALVSGRTPRQAAPSSPFVARVEALTATLAPRVVAGATPP